MPGVSFAAKLSGYSRIIDGLQELRDEWTTDSSWVVGTDAEYAIFVHEGTSRMEGRPFLTDAVDAVAREKGDEIAKRASNADEVAMMIALELEGETKEQITAYNAVDTGNMRAGVAAVKL